MQIIFGLLMVAAYFWFVSMLLAVAGPNLLVILGGAFVAGGLWILCRSFYSVYGSGEKKTWLWVPAGVVLSYLYFDYLRIIAAMNQQSLVGGFLHFLFLPIGLPSVAAVVPGAANQSMSGPGGYLVGSMVFGMALPPLVLLARGFSCSDTKEPEPAFLWYFHRQAFGDLRRAVVEFGRAIGPYCYDAVKKVSRWTLSKDLFWMVWPIALSAYLGLLIPGLFAGVVIVVWISAFAIGLGLLWLGAHYASVLMRCFERAVLKVRAGYVKCPQAQCHKPLPLPVFRCPDCGEAHQSLLPGQYGIFRRRCRCGQVLPTLYWFGKKQLAAECCHCGQPLAEEMFGANLHFPIYGGPDAGKSTFLAAATDEIHSRGLEGYRFGWMVERDRLQFEGQWKPLLDSGQKLEKTVDTFPDAFLLSAQAEGGLPASLYLYDPAGDAFFDGHILEEHHFIKYADGIILVLDPLAFSEPGEEVEGRGPERSHRLEPREVLDRIVNQMESQAGLKRSRGFSKPMAVVVAKADLAPVAGELGSSIESAEVRKWVARRDAGLVHALETRFRSVGFFAVSALGYTSKTSDASLLDPIVWLLSHQGVLSRPRLTRWGGVLLEVSAAVTLALGGILLPWLVLAVLMDLAG